MIMPRLVVEYAGGSCPMHIPSRGNPDISLCGKPIAGYYNLPAGIEHKHVPCSRCNREYLSRIEPAAEPEHVSAHAVKVTTAGA